MKAGLHRRRRKWRRREARRRLRGRARAEGVGVADGQRLKTPRGGEARVEEEAAELRRVLEALRRVLVDGAPDGLLDHLGDGRVELARRHRVLLDLRLHQLELVLDVERAAA